MKVFFVLYQLIIKTDNLIFFCSMAFQKVTDAEVTTDLNKPTDQSKKKWDANKEVLKTTVGVVFDDEQNFILELHMYFNINILI